jgi:hypothetical protein
VPNILRRQSGTRWLHAVLILPLDGSANNNLSVVTVVFLMKYAYSRASNLWFVIFFNTGRYDRTVSMESATPP